MGAADRQYPIKVCMVVAYFHPIVGGVERQARKLSRALIDHGAKVVVLTRRTPGTHLYEDIDGIPVYRMPIPVRSGPLAALSFIFFSLLWIFRNRYNIDVIHCHQAYSPAIIGVLGKLLFGKKVIVKMTTAGTISEVRAVTEELPFAWMRNILLKFVDLFITISPQIEKEMLDKGFPREKISLLPNGVFIPGESAFDNSAKKKHRHMVHFGPSEKIAIYVGRLGKGKGLEILLQAWKTVVDSLPNAKLRFVGEGNEGIPGGGAWVSVEENLRRLIIELGIASSVEFLGRRDNVEDYLLASDVFVLPSESEGMSNALLEAMAAGLPVVVNKIPAHSDIIRDGVNGIMVEPNSPRDLAGALVILFRDEDLSRRLGSVARETASARYSFEHISRKYIEIYTLMRDNTQ